MLESLGSRGASSAIVTSCTKAISETSTFEAIPEALAITFDLTNSYPKDHEPDLEDQSDIMDLTKLPKNQENPRKIIQKLDGKNSKNIIKIKNGKERWMP